MCGKFALAGLGTPCLPATLLHRHGMVSKGRIGRDV